MDYRWDGTGLILHLTGRAIDHLFWGGLDDAELSGVRTAIVDPEVDEDVRSEAAMRRSEKLRAIGSEARGDPETGMVFCLSEAPSKEAVMRPTRASHPTDEVYEITAAV